MIYLRSLIYSIGNIVTTVIFGFGGVLTFPFPFRIRYGYISQWAKFNLRWLKLTCKLGYHVEGQENIPRGNGIIFCKHQSTWETMVLQRLFPPQVWILKRELLWIPFFGWGLAALKPIAIDRGSGRRAVSQIKQQGLQRLKEGIWVVVFPEGTRVAPGKRRRYGIGGAVLAANSGYPVVPVAHNAGEYWPRRSFLKMPGTIQVRIGPAIETGDKTADEINQAAETWIEDTMLSISAIPVEKPAA